MADYENHADTAEEAGVMYVRTPLPEALPDDMELMNVLSQLSAEDRGVTVGVYRQLGQGKKLSYVCGYTPEEFNLDRLRDDHGGGDYRIQIRKDGGLIANRSVSLEEIKREVAAVASPSAPSLGIEHLANTMVQGFQELGKLIVQVSAANNQAPNRREMLEEMQMMMAILGGNRPASTGGELDNFLKGIEFAKSNMPVKEKDDDDSPMGVLKETIATLGPAIAQAATMRTQPQAQPVAAPAQPEEDPMFLIRYYLNILVAKAAENKDPSLYAELVLDNAPEEAINQMLNDPNIIDRLAEIDPRVNNYRPWFYGLVSSVSEMVNEEVGNVLQSGTQSASVISTSSLPSQNADNANAHGDSVG